MSMLRPTDESPLSDSARQVEYDALAELFLGDQGAAPARLRLHDPDKVDPPARRTPERPPATIEALVLGHLPVLAGPWVAQYARFLADERREAVALVRVAGDQASIDLYSDPPRASRNAAVDIEHALDEAAPIADRWVFRVDAVTEPAMATSDRVDAVTLLCGADDAAIVSAYRTIKRLLPAREPGVLEDALEPAPIGPVRRVVIIGAPEERAREAAEKLRRAAEAFLDARIEAIVGPSRLGPSSGATLYRGSAEGGAEILAGRVRACVDGAEGIVAAAHTHAPDLDEPMHAATQRGVDVPEASVPAPGLDPASIGADAPPEAGALARRIDGLRSLPVHCPYDASVELAVDADRRLHLLAPYSPVACRAMEVVEAWAQDHVAMLDALIAGGAFDRDLEPARHLFVERPAEARRLLDTPYRVHLLTPVEVEGRGGWCCVSLND